MNTTITPGTVVTQDKQTLVGPKICLMGLGGTGKTYAIGTLCDWAERNGFEVAVLFTENGLETLLGYFRDHGKEPPPNVFWHQQGTRPLSLKALMQTADNVNASIGPRTLPVRSSTKLEQDCRILKKALLSPPRLESTDLASAS